jgi:hypothetical protein
MMNSVGSAYESGLAPLMKISDVDLANVVRERLPSKCYTGVYVKTMSYNFAGISKTEARFINLAVTKMEYCSSFLYAVFAGIGLLDSKGLDSNVDKDKLKNSLLDHICTSKGDAEELQKAYLQCTDIDLCIATDLSAIEMKIRQNNSIVMAYKISQVAVKVIPILVPIIIGSISKGSS